MKKAIDTVNHAILIENLYHYGVQGKELDWFEHYSFKHTLLFYTYNSGHTSLGHLEETDKKPFSSTYCHSCYKRAPPFPLEQC